MSEDFPFDDVIESWRRIAACAGLTLEIRRNEESLRLGEPFPATPHRIERGWKFIHPEGHAYRVQVGRCLTVSHRAPASAAFEQRFLLHAGAITAMVMWSCGYFPMHAAALHFPQGVAALLAEPGGGKSTLAAIAAGNGVAIHGDDLLAMTPSAEILALAGSLRVAPRDAPPAWSPRFQLADGRGWYPLAAPERNLPLRSLVLLRRGGPPALSPVRGHRRLSVLLASGFLCRFDPELPDGWEATILDLSARLSVWELQVPDGLEQLRDAWPETRTLLVQSCE